MRNKKIILFSAAIMIAAIGVKTIALFNEKPEESEKTNEEYMAVLINNKKDFDYVVEVMQQWPVRSRIDFDGGISSDNQEIVDEILNNENFYGHLKNINDLNEIDYLIVWEDEIKFDFKIYPKDYHCGLYYVENAVEDHFYKHKIDEHWMLYMIPNT